MSINSQGIISPVGIFGILEENQEDYFQKLQIQYSKFTGHEEENTFNHLSLVINKDEPTEKLSIYKELLSNLKKYLPFHIATEDIIVIEDKYIALAFNPEACNELRNLARMLFSKGIVETYYMKVVRYVDEQDRDKVIDILKSTKEIIINDFVLVTEKLDKEHIVASSSKM